MKKHLAGMPNYLFLLLMEKKKERKTFSVGSRKATASNGHAPDPHEHLRYQLCVTAIQTK
jgi:hypothetical protein